MKWAVCVQRITPHLLLDPPVHLYICMYVLYSLVHQVDSHADEESATLEGVGQPLTEFPAMIIDWRANMRKERSLSTGIRRGLVF